MRAGALDRRVTLLRPVDETGPAGEALVHWQTVAEVWGEKRELRGREYYAAAAVQAELDVVFRIRWPGIAAHHPAPRWRLRCEGRDYDIQAVAEIGRREGLELRCVAAIEG